LGEKWHNECFVCFHCKKILTNEFFDYNNHPYCKVCIINQQQS
jgi:hypothetical protein